MADNTIDSLNIEITAGVADAVKAVQRAKRNLKGLEEVISRVDKLKANFTALKDFSEAMKGLSELKDVSEYVKVANRGMRSLETLVRRVNNIKFDGSGINAFTDTMRQLADAGGNERMTAAVENIRAAASSGAFRRTRKLQQAQWQPQSQEEISSIVDAAIERYNNSYKNLRTSGTIGGGGKMDWNEVRKQQQEVADFIDAYISDPIRAPKKTQTLEEISSIVDAAAARYNNRHKNLRTSGTIGESGTPFDIDKIKRDQAAVTEYINVYAEGLEKLGKKTKRNAALFDELAQKAQAASDRVREMYGVEVQTQTNRFSDMIKNLRKQLGFSGDIKSSGLVDKLKEISALLFEKKTMSRRGILSILGRSLVFSTFYRGISLVTQGLREGTDNLYQYSKAAGSAFAPALDAMSTSMLYLKNSIAAAAAPLIQTLSPAIDFVVDKIVSFTNVLNQLFAKLSGASTWTRATKIQKDYADALGDTASEAKKAKNILVGFDELNIFDPVSGDSSSSFTGANPDPTTMFEEMDISTVNADISKFADKIKEIATSVTEEFEKVKEKIGNVMDFLGIDFGDILTTVGAVGAAILGWKLAQDFVSGVSALASTVAALKVPISLALSIGGLKLFSDNLDELIAGTGDWKNVIGAVLGAAMNIAGMTWLFGTSGLVISLATLLELSGWKLIKDAVSKFRDGEGGWSTWIEAGVGAVLAAAGVTAATLMFGTAGLVISLGALLTLAFSEIKANADEKFWKSEIGREVKRIQDTANENYDYSVNLLLEIDKIDTPVAELEEKFSTLRTMVDEAFSLNDIPAEDRTSEEASRLKALVEGINEMDIIKLEFDGTSITSTKEETNALIDDTLRYYQTLAYQDAYIEAFKKNAEAVQELESAQGDLNEAQSLVNEYAETFYNSTPDWIKDLLGIKDASEAADSKILGMAGSLEALVGKGKDWLGVASDEEVQFYKNEKALREAQDAVEKNKDAIDNLTEAVKVSKEKVDYYGDALGKLQDTEIDIGMNVDTRELDDAIDKLETKFEIKSVQKSNARYNSDRYQAMASGGVAYRPTHALIGEYAGASSNPEIVTPQDLMFETMVRANEASNAGTNALLRKILNAVEESGGGETTVTITTADVVAALDRKNRRVGKTVVPVAVN